MGRHWKFHDRIVAGHEVRRSTPMFMLREDQTFAQALEVHYLLSQHYASLSVHQSAPVQDCRKADVDAEREAD